MARRKKSKDAPQERRNRVKESIKESHRRQIRQSEKDVKAPSETERARKTSRETRRRQTERLRPLENTARESHGENSQEEDAEGGEVENARRRAAKLRRKREDARRFKITRSDVTGDVDGIPSDVAVKP